MQAGTDQAGTDQAGTDQAAAAPGTAAEVSLGAAAQASAENFPVAIRILPARYRRHLMALYGFARLTDDIGDEVTPEARLRLLDELEADVARIFDGSGPRLAVLRELAVTVTECGVPAQPLLDLIQANRQDQIVTRYETFEDLVGYCRLSANPVGLVVLYIFAAASPARERLSDSICTALQLVEHWQDVAEDLRQDRIYLPRQDMEQFGVTEQDLAARCDGTAGSRADRLRGGPRVRPAGRGSAARRDAPRRGAAGGGRLCGGWPGRAVRARELRERCPGDDPAAR